MLHKLTRCMYFLHDKSIDDNRTLVVSGGCASSRVLTEDLNKLCRLRNYKLFIPPPNVCIDNAVMIGYTAHEMVESGFEPIRCEDLETVEVDGFAKIGNDATRSVNISKHITSNFRRLTMSEFSIANEINGFERSSNSFGSFERILKH